MKKLIILIVLTLLLTACAAEDQTDKNKEGIVKPSVEEKQKTDESEESTFLNQIQIAAPTQKDVETLPEQTSVTIKTNKGDITIELLPKTAPLAVANFLNLTKAGFYDGIKFHRVIPDFMIQTGDPNSKDNNWTDDGAGGPGYSFADEVSSNDQLIRGSAAMANAGPGTNGSQFFIVTAEATPWLNGRHTIFGQVSAGMEVAEAISQVPRNSIDHPLEDVIIEKVEIYPNF